MSDEKKCCICGEKATTQARNKEPLCDDCNKINRGIEGKKK